MARIYPFQALMPDPSLVEQVSAVPYDVVDRAEAKALANGNPLSFLRVSRPEIELPDETAFDADAVYEKAAVNFARLRQTAPLTPDTEARFYVYAVTAGEHTQTGIVAAAAVDDYDADVIKKHEKTRPDKEDDRTRHLLATKAHTGPVFLLFCAREDVARMITAVKRTDAHFDFVAEDGSRHQVWLCPPELTPELAQAFADLGPLYVADGHHRAKSASRARAACRQANPQHTGAETYNRFLAVMFPHDELQILPYNRVVKDLNGRRAAEFLGAVKEVLPVSEDAPPCPAAPGLASMYLDGKWYGLALNADAATARRPEELDVSILQTKVLAPLLAIENPRTSPKIEFVGGIHGTARLQEYVDGGRGSVAFSMHPVRVEQLIAISDMGACMPPKSTWFEPKLRDGLLIHLFE